jgi:Holliday junction resolvasome RuvABC endonuclease subunit
MRVAGAAIRIEDGAYVVGLTLLEDDRVAADFSFTAPRDLDEAGQLGELFRRASDLLGEWSPDAVAIYRGEHARSPARAVIAHHAEGAIMAAAGDRGLPVRSWTGRALGGAAGYSKAVTHERARARLLRELTEQPATQEGRFAAAAARASIVRSA